MPKLQRRLTREPDSPASMANVRTDCLRSPFMYKHEDVKKAACRHLVAKPAQVMMTPAGFRPPAVRLLSPAYPNKVHVVVVKADQRNDILPLELEGQLYNRVVFTDYMAVEEETKGWFKVSDYTDDGHMILSVLCYFHIVEEEEIVGQDAENEEEGGNLHGGEQY